jgi:hypothetical protein
MLFGCLLVELGGFALFDGDGVLGAMAQACAEPVTVDLADQLRLAVHYLNSTFGTGSNTLTTSVAFFFVNYDYVS